MTALTPDTRQEWTTRLAQALVKSGYETDANIKPLLNEAIATDQSLAYLLVSRNVALPSVVVGTLSQLSQLPAVDLAAFTAQPDAIAALPSPLAQEYQAMALQFDGNALSVAFAEPPTPQRVDELAGRIGHRIHPVLADPVLIAQAVGAVPNAPSGAAPTDPSGAVPNAPSGADAPQGAAPAGDVDDLLTTGISAGTDSTVPLHIDDLLRYAVSVGASDLHLTVAMPGTIRLHGAMQPIQGCPPLDNDTIRDMIFGILPGSQRERFEAEHELDTSHTIPGVGRFRVNVALQRGTVTAALRPIPHEMPVFASLGLPDTIRTFTDLRRGLVLVTGPTGSGKSTTLASLIDIINRTKPMHIVTVEDPIEFLHDHKRSIITQREIGEDTNSFSEALRRVLRQDPDVILVGEMRDLETVATALTAAETGHLILSTLHTSDVAQAIHRIIDVFPPVQQTQIRQQLSMSLNAIVVQQLVPSSAGERAVAVEVLLANAAVRNHIRREKMENLITEITLGKRQGMISFEDSLARLVRQGVIAVDEARIRSTRPEELESQLRT
jgi:twitching motility protein PilT